MIVNDPKSTPAQLPFQPVTLPFGTPNVYFNGFIIGLSGADVSLLLTVDGQPQCKLSMSFTTAKTLKSQLSQIMDDLEKVTGHEIMVVDQVNEGLSKMEAKREAT